MRFYSQYGFVFLLCREFFRSLFHGESGVKEGQQFGDRHGEPKGVGSEGGGQKEDQDPADNKSSDNGNKEGRFRFQDCLKIVGGKDVEGQQKEGNGIAADHRRGCGQYFRGGAHKNADEQVREEKAHHCPDHPEQSSCH